MLNILDFGASPAAPLNTASIQAAIDACPTGGTVLIPAGTFRTGALFLHSGMTLLLAAGATLLGSDDPADYPICRYSFEGRGEGPSYASLLNTEDVHARPGEEHYATGHITTAEKRLHDIRIEGEGTIDASGTPLKERELAQAHGWRGRAIFLRNVDGIFIRGVTVRHSPAWCVHTQFCTDILVEDAHICTKFAADGSRYDVFNGDGIDIDSCQDVVIRHCLIESQDDCIAIKSGRDEAGRVIAVPTENVEIADCTFRYGFGVAMGSEMSAGVRNVHVHDCLFEDTYSLCSVKAPRGRGGVIEHIRYERLRHYNHSLEHSDCRWFRGAVYIDQFYSHEEYDPNTPQPITEGTPVIRNITLRDIQSETVAGNAIFLQGLPEQHLQAITLENIQARGLTGLTVANADGVIMRQVTAEIL